MKNIIISPSILNSDFLHLEDEIQKIITAGGSWLHLDVMDGDFVPNISVGNLFFERISPSINLVKDVHIMVSKPIIYIEKFAKAGADYLTFHYEACKDNEEINEIIDLIHSHGMKAGLSIKPSTLVEEVFPFLDKLDLVLIMSVVPGKGGQKFIEDSLTRISSLKLEIRKRNAKTLISVDGGINDKTAPLCIQSGADILVVGSYLFNSQDFVSNYKKLLK